MREGALWAWNQGGMGDWSRGHDSGAASTACQVVEGRLPSSSATPAASCGPGQPAAGAGVAAAVVAGARLPGVYMPAPGARAPRAAGAAGTAGTLEEDRQPVEEGRAAQEATGPVVMAERRQHRLLQPLLPPGGRPYD